MRVSVYLLVFMYACVSIYAENEDRALTSPVIRKNKQSNQLTYAGKSYYVATIFKANFYRAVQFCRQMSMQLVSITNLAENNRLGKFVEELGVGTGHFWTSGSNLGDKNQWVWLSTGNNIVFANWHPGEPNGLNADRVNVSENCIELRHAKEGFTWNDLNCFAEFYFICESTSDCAK